MDSTQNNYNRAVVSFSSIVCLKSNSKCVDGKFPSHAQTGWQLAPRVALYSWYEIRFQTHTHTSTKHKSESNLRKNINNSKGYYS